MNKFLAVAVFLMGVASVWTTPASAPDSDPSVGQRGVLPHIVLVSDDGVEITPQILADRFREKIDSMPDLSVHSDKDYSYFTVPFSDNEGPQRDAGLALDTLSASSSPNFVPTRVSIDSYMTLTSVKSTFHRDDVGKRPVVEIGISPEICAVMFFHPKLNTVTAGIFSTSDLGGDDFIDYIQDRMEDPLLFDIPGACGNSEFWYSWIGSYSADWADTISRGDLSGLQKRDGRNVYRVECVVQDFDDHYRRDVIFVDVETGLVVGWQKFISYFDLENKEAHYQIVDGGYEYLSSEEGEVSVSISEVRE